VQEGEKTEALPTHLNSDLDVSISKQPVSGILPEGGRTPDKGMASSIIPHMSTMPLREGERSLPSEDQVCMPGKWEMPKSGEGLTLSDDLDNSWSGLLKGLHWKQ